VQPPVVLARERADLDALFRLDRRAEAATSDARRAVALLPDPEAVQVVVVPLEGDLQNRVQVGSNA
jgi:hypothetical protein